MITRHQLLKLGNGSLVTSLDIVLCLEDTTDAILLGRSNVWADEVIMSSNKGSEGENIWRGFAISSISAHLFHEVYLGYLQHVWGSLSVL